MKTEIYRRNGELEVIPQSAKDAVIRELLRNEFTQVIKRGNTWFILDHPGTASLAAIYGAD